MRYLLAAVLGLMLFASAGAQDMEMAGDSIFQPEFGLITANMEVVNTEPGGKYHLLGTRHLKKGEKCLIGAGSIIRRIGDEEGGGVEVRFETAWPAAPEYCPFKTPFVMIGQDWQRARAAFKASSYWDLIREATGFGKKK